MKKICALVSGLLLAATVFAQEITTANDFFSQVSNYYATFEDYEADVDITIGKSEMNGRLSFKRPGMFRIDFETPAEQCINFDGDTLKIYLPGYSAILEQSVSGTTQGVTGLALIKRYYTIAYETGQAPVPLEDGSDEMVINLICNLRSSTEAFRSILISVDPVSKLIVRVTAVPVQGDTYVLDFSNYKMNTHMGESRFIYDPPSSANNYNNFLFEE